LNVKRLDYIKRVNDHNFLSVNIGFLLIKKLAICELFNE